MDNLHGVITLFLVIAAGGVIGGFGAYIGWNLASALDTKLGRRIG